MKQVTAFQDDVGRLYKSRRYAIEADFIMKIQRAWGALPDLRDRGDPAVIARSLAGYLGARTMVAEAITWFDKQIAEDVQSRTPQKSETAND